MDKRDKIAKLSFMLIVGAIFLSVFIVYNISSNKSSTLVSGSLDEFIHEESIPFEDEILKNEVIKEENSIFVEIKGEVLYPNVYEVKEGSIVKDLIDLSGGVTSIGDLSNINQARKLLDGECIVVYSSEDLKNLNIDSNLNSEALTLNTYETDVSSDMVDINNGSKYDLKKLDGIGDKLAESIISYRESNGPFKSIEDIKNVPRIGDKTFDRFKDKIKV